MLKYWPALIFVDQAENPEAVLKYLWADLLNKLCVGDSWALDKIITQEENLIYCTAITIIHRNNLKGVGPSTLI